jgi:hypothetical protein
MNDRELLEFAAKAAGHEFKDMEGRWNPLTYDGDALRLAVKLGLDVEMHGCTAPLSFACAFDCMRNIAEEVEADDGDPYAATRRAIVRAAAEIGKAIP